MIVGIKGVVRGRNSKTDRQSNDKEKKDKNANNSPQNIQKLTNMNIAKIRSGVPKALLVFLSLIMLLFFKC